MFKNVASQKIAVFAFTITTGAAKTGDAANITVYVSKDYGAVTALTDTSATEMDATNAPGWYLFDVSQTETNADALLFTGKSATANISVVGQLIFTTPANFSALSVDSNGRVDVIKVAGTTQTARDIGASVLLSAGTGTGQLDFTSGVVKANATQINAVSTSSVTTVNANIGQTQPVNFTGTGASALVKSDMVDVAGAAVSTSTAQLGVNVVNNAGSAITSAAGIQEVKVASIAANAITATSIAADAITDAKVAADVTIASVTGSVGSVTGAVGSVTGNVGGNVVGSVASVTGNVGGNVTGSVGSVATGGIAAASFAAGAINAAAIATDAIDADALAADAATEITDALLKRDMSAVTGEAARSPLNALRFLRNKWSVAAGTLTVTKEDDTTSAWTSAVTGTTGADPITASDPV